MRKIVTLAIVLLMLVTVILILSAKAGPTIPPIPSTPTPGAIPTPWEVQTINQATVTLPANFYPPTR